MGDDLPPGHQPPQLIESTENVLQDSSPQSQARPNVHQSQSNMDIEGYPRHHFGMGHHQGVSMLDMSNMANALPDYSRQFHPHAFQQQYPQQMSTNQSLMYQYHQGTPFAGQTATNYHASLGQHYQSQYHLNQPGRQQQPQFSQFMGGASMPNSSNSFLPPNYAMQQPIAQNMGPGHQSHQQGLLQQHQNVSYGGYGMRVGSGYQVPQLRVDSNVSPGHAMPFYQQPSTQAVRRTSSNSSLQASLLRGPPRKPKQSGYALWVGNLPPGTHIIDLKDHFSRDATEDIESVFLISKSNCAFVNYKSEASCTAAMSRFHDSRFQGVRLVCRLRRGGAHTTSPSVSGVQTLSQTVAGDAAENEKESQTAEKADTNTDPRVEVPVDEEEEQQEKAKEKFFIVKSLTMEDLERSVHSGVWATQAHNEGVLNKAYQNAENVYLIFSANKSGEYFGYARMQSVISDAAASTIEFPVRREAPEPNPSDLPVTIPTPATATAPKGRIIDDSARGTIFWEAEHEDKDETQKDEDPGNLSGEGDESGVSGGASPGTPQTFGKPFKITWMSTDRLPFYRTRGLRNPWNANREVKIARDGTELEPTVGRRLVNMFHHPQIPPQSSTSPVFMRQPTFLGPNPGNQAGYMQHPPHQGQMHGRPY